MKLKIQLPKKAQFLLTKKSRYKCLVGGRGCVHGDTLIETPSGKVKIKDFTGGLIYAYSDKGIIEAYACKPLKYPSETLYKVALDESDVIVTANHRFLTPRGWVKTSNLSCEDEILLHGCDAFPLPTSLDTSQLVSPVDVGRYLQIILGCLYRYWQDFHLYDELLPEVPDTYLDVLPLLADEELHSYHMLNHKDGLEFSYICDRFYQFCNHLSILVSLQNEEEKNSEDMETYNGDKFSEWLSESFQIIEQFRECTNLEKLIQHISKKLLALYNLKRQERIPQIVFDTLERVFDDNSYSESLCNCNHNHHNIKRKKVKSISYYSTENFYDMFVPFFNNYIGNGIIHHNSAKSFSIAIALIVLSMRKKCRILCARMFQNSISDSVHRLLCDVIEKYNLSDAFIIQKDAIICKMTGSDFFFKGIKNSIGEIKSTQGINYCWIEEAADVTEEAWDILIPTVREAGSEIWISFNPNMKTDATYQKFVVNKPENCITEIMNYSDNPFFPDVLREEMEFCKALNYPKYEHIWLGVPNAEAGNLIKMAYFKRYTYPPKHFDLLFIVCDTAFSEKKSADNSAFLLCGIADGQRYILDMYFKKVTFVELVRDLKSFYASALERYGRTSSFSSIYIENKASGISLIQQLREEKLPILEIYPTVHNAQLKKDMVADKYTRFLEIEADLASGLVSIPESAHWLPEFERECEAFTGGKQNEKDDGIDVTIYMLKIARKFQEPDWEAVRRAFS